MSADAMRAPAVGPELAAEIERNVARALEEDVGAGDLTALLIAEHAQARASVISRADAVLCGARWFEACFRRLDSRIAIRWNAADGDCVTAGQTLCTVAGSARALLTGERSGLLLDPEAASFFLMDLTVERVIPWTETLGQARGQGAALLARGDANTVERAALIGRADSLRAYPFREIIVQHPDRLSPTAITVRLLDCIFPQKGVYFVEVWYDDRWVVDRRLEVE